MRHIGSKGLRLCIGAKINNYLLMLDKRYQVFVSSTYKDLIDERRAVINEIMSLDCIPSGMELFPATDEEQFEFIKRIIDDCDYYVLILGGRYGSLAEDGISYTEKEYLYALSKGIHVLAFIQEEDSILQDNKEMDQNLIAKLKAFKERVMEGRVVKMWSNRSDLTTSVIRSLTHEMRVYPAVGWIRANKVASEDALQDMARLQKEVEELRKYKAEVESSRQSLYQEIASLDEKYILTGTSSYWSRAYQYDVSEKFSIEESWRDIFAALAPHLLENPNDFRAKSYVESWIKRVKLSTSSTVLLDEEVFNTIKIQFIALGLVEVKYSQTTKGEMALFWHLTKYGYSVMMENRIIKKQPK